MNQNDNLNPTTPNVAMDPAVGQAPVMQTPVTPAPMAQNVTPVAAKGAGLAAKLGSFGIGPIIAIAAVVVVLVGGVVFSVLSSSPKAVFKSTINRAYKEVNNAIDTYGEYKEKFDPTEKALLISADVEMDANLEELEDFELKGLKVGGELGVDYKNEVLYANGFVKGEKEEISIGGQVKNNELYVISSLLEEAVKVELEEELDIDFESLKEEVEAFKDEIDMEAETYEYIAEAVKNALVKSLDSEYMEKESDKVDVGKKEIKVTKYSYELKDKALRGMVETIAEELLDDDKFIENLANASGMEEDEIEEALESLKDSADDIEFEEKIVLSIYTRGMLQSFAGFSLKVEGHEFVTYFTDGKNAELTIDGGGEGEYASKLVVTIEENKKGYDIVAKQNKEELLTIKVKELTEEKIDLVVEVPEAGDDGETVKFEFAISLKEEKTKISGSYKVALAMGDQSVSLAGNYAVEAKDKIDEVDVDKAVSPEEVDEEKLEQKLEEIIENDEVLGSLLEEALSEMEPEVDYETPEYDDTYTYDGMIEIDDYSTLTINDVLAKQEATVLFVGSEFYSTSETAAYNMYNDLVALQDELNFHSYFLYYLYADEDFKTLVKDVTYTCDTATQTATCAEYPTIYLIKEGKVQKAIRGSITKEELKTALSEIGIQ